ncbi:PAS domain-containing protein, partial [Streptomyces sp. NPDC058964]|uniref:PAS domain-containing protein n=1 Tax=Streptomyces sp. NPDC058964 TaxID=3346681 RepID=UPI003676F6CC
MDRFPKAPHVEFRSPADLSKAATAVLDDDGRITGWGSSAQRLLGHSPEDVLGEPAAQLLATPPGHLPYALCKGHTPRSTVLDLRHRDGGTLHAAVTFCPLSHQGAGGAPGGAAARAAGSRLAAQQGILQGLISECT